MTNRAQRIAGLLANRRRGVWCSCIVGTTWPELESWLMNHVAGWLALDTGQGRLLFSGSKLALSAARGERLLPADEAVALASATLAKHDRPAAVSQEWLELLWDEPARAAA